MDIRIIRLAEMQEEWVFCSYSLRGNIGLSDKDEVT
jgi:hypothetical protein